MTSQEPEIFLAFTNKIPTGHTESAILISGKESVNEKGQEFLLLKQNDKIQKVFEIKYTTYGGPYKEAVVFNNLLIVGHYQFVYIYDLLQNNGILRMEVSGYFGHIYIDGDKFYISDASGIYCFNGTGRVVWRNTQLGIDGVFISDFNNTEITGSGQWDPPDGWNDFILDKETGYKIR
jgi:hypothetical protein